MGNLKKWYVLRAVGGKEKKAKEYIESEIRQQNLENYVFQILIPTEKVYQVKGGKKILRERASYPGYIMVEAILTGEVVHILRNVPNVAGFVTEKKGGDPVPLRDYEANRMLGHIDSMAEGEEELDIPYLVGEPVNVIDGPFSGFAGTIVEVNEEKKKVKVMVKIFERKTPLELSFVQIEKSN